VRLMCLVLLVTKRDRWESTSQGLVMCENYVLERGLRGIYLHYYYYYYYYEGV
jgi:hypothetical protein